MRQHHLYFMITECEMFVKIGISSKIELRFSDIQRHSPLKLKLVKILCEKRSQACKLETSLHFEFKNYHLHSEWFKYAEIIQKRVKRLVREPIFSTRRKYRRGLPKLATIKDLYKGGPPCHTN